MKIAVLSRGKKLYSTRRLVEASRARGHTVRILDTLHFSIHVEEGDPELFYRGKALSSGLVPMRKRRKRKPQAGGPTPAESGGVL